MHIPKRYGQSRIDKCPFCGKQGVTENPQGVPVCPAHKSQNLSELKCLCGSYVDILSGKWGAYAKCMKCGNVNLGRILEMNPQQKPQQQNQEEKTSEKQQEKREITVRSDELEFLY